jgi:WD40 repeat protein
MWDTATGQGRPVLGPKDLGSYVHDLALSPDGGRLVTAHGDGTVKIWSVKQLLGRRGDR